MELDKNELHLINNLRLYKLIAVSCMLIPGAGVIFGIFVSITQPERYAQNHLHNALIGASIAMSGMGYLIFCLLKAVDKLRQRW